MSDANTGFILLYQIIVTQLYVSIAFLSCRVVVRKKFDLGSPDAQGDNVKHMHVLLRDTPGDPFAKPVLLVPKTQQLRDDLQAASFVQPPVEPLCHAAMFNMTSFKDEQQKLADVIQQAWVILCAFLISNTEVTAESVEAMAAQLQQPLSPDNLKFAKERCTDCSQKLKSESYDTFTTLKAVVFHVGLYVILPSRTLLAARHHIVGWIVCASTLMHVIHLPVK